MNLIPQSEFITLTKEEIEAIGGAVGVYNESTGLVTVYNTQIVSSVGKYIPNSDSTKVICEAYASNFDANSNSWGIGSKPLNVIGTFNYVGGTENAVYVNTREQSQASAYFATAYCDLGEANTPFTVYVVMKLKNESLPDGFRILAVSYAESAGNGMWLIRTPIQVSSYQNDSSTGVSCMDYFVGFLQFSSPGNAYGGVLGSSYITKPASNCGRFIVLCNGKYNQEYSSCNGYVRYVGVTRSLDSQEQITANMQNLKTHFIDNY